MLTRISAALDKTQNFYQAQGYQKHDQGDHHAPALALVVLDQYWGWRGNFQPGDNQLLLDRFLLFEFL